MQFPRHIFKKRRVCYTLDSMIEQFNLYNGRRDCFLSLYNFDVKDGKADYTNSVIDKVFFDFDNPGENLEPVKKMHNLLLTKNLKHRIAFSGRGVHLYILTNKKQLKNKKAALLTFQKHICEEAELSIGDPKTSNIDAHCCGDIARVSRFTNTVNLRSKLYCILLTEGNLQMSLSEIRILAQRPQFPEKFLFGSELADLTPYDKEQNDTFSPKIELESTSVINENYPPCIKYLLSKVDLNVKDRYLVIIYLRDIGLTKKEATEILKKYLSPRKFKHCLYEERQLDYLYMKNTYFLNRSHFEEHGACFNCHDCPIKKLYKEWNGKE